MKSSLVFVVYFNLKLNHIFVFIVATRGLIYREGIFK